MDKLYQDGTKCPQIENLAKITPEQAAAYVRFVAELRHQQRRWFNLHNHTALLLAKKMETELDVLNGRLLNPTPKLF